MGAYIFIFLAATLFVCAVLYFVIKAAVRDAILELQGDPQTEETEEESGWSACPNCGRKHRSDSPQCPHCGHDNQSGNNQ